jgi:hypothetical protein
MIFFRNPCVCARTQENRQKCIAHTRARNNSIFIFRTKYPSPHAHQAIVLISILLSQKFPLFVNLSKNDKFLLFISKTRFTFAYR